VVGVTSFFCGALARVLVFVLAPSAPFPFATARVVPCVVNWVRDGMGAFQNQYKSPRASELWPNDLGEKGMSFSRGDLVGSARGALHFGRKVLHF